jgi:hypothetical protein
VIVFRLLRAVVRAIFRLTYFVGGAAAILLVLLLAAEGILFLLRVAPETSAGNVAYGRTALADGQLPQHDAQLFIRPSVLQDFGLLYVNLKLSPNWFPLTLIGPEPTLTTAQVRAEVGHLNASAEVKFWHIGMIADLTMAFDRIDLRRHLKHQDDGQYVDDPKDNDCDLVFVPHIERVRLARAAQGFVEWLSPRFTRMSERALGQ